eukprot:Plantae.Rhodophyta-Hildenbrandia_rubra.ctg26994.p1 GENE.Plantae.Rhodophyta-Hildenbrandia_rubra.ctg26994~~Plantae.Rhodophyta-Hildenbrandia_rubra.ctg26994.p1  ORF type:complete len:360 (+),score=84.92 Plantae.Rhodophyta-Hildenbrandia_rubra.ctg26994:143-1222(+)
MAFSSSILILLTILIALCSTARTNAAEISENSFEGNYERIGGPETEQCPEDFEFDDDDDDLKTDEIVIASEKCTRKDDEIKFLENEKPDNDSVTAFLDGLDDDNDATWVTAEFPSLMCGNTTYNFQRVTVFVIDDDDLDIKWTDVYDGVPLNNIQLAGGKDAFTLKEDQAYMITGDGTCLYRRKELLEDLDVAKCFPAGAKVTLESGHHVKMDQVKVGDRVLVGDDTYSDVFMFTHADSKFTSSAYVRLYADDNSHITLTPSHYIYANNRLVTASAVKAGDILTKADGSIAKVEKVRHGVHGKGLYNPQTLHGDIVVDGFVASTYTTAVRPKLAHKLLTPLRAIYRYFSGPALVASSDL